MEHSETAPDRAAGENGQSDIVVALPHRPALKSKLAELGVRLGDEESDDGLGLARLRLPELATNVKPLRDDRALVQAALDARRASNLDSEISDLELLMYKIRRDFQQAYGGWTPIIGKNRYVEPIHPWGPEIVGGVGGYWRQAEASAVRISRPSVGPGRAVRVGILDTPLYAHTRLRGSYLAADDSVLASAPWHPQSAGHATFVAGLILQQAPGAELDVRSGLTESGTSTAWDIARTMMTFVGSEVEILNLSWGCRVPDGQPPLVLARAVEKLSKHMVIVVAAGNHTVKPGQPGYVPRATPTYPAALPDIVAVAAADHEGRPAEFNPDGPWINLLAHGVNVTSTYLKGNVLVTTDQGPVITKFRGYGRASGTSFAAANVAGELAAWAHRDQRSPHEVLHDMLNQTTENGTYRAHPYSALR